MPAKPFIDTHCHLFNIVDVPLYETVLGKVRMNTFERILLVPFGFFVGLFKDIDDLIEKREDIIRFFEYDIEGNLKWICDQLREAVSARHDKADVIVITPLVMDFDEVREVEASGYATTVKEQLKRLQAAIDRKAALLDQDPPVKVFPFFGYDLRKLYEAPDGALTFLEQLWKDEGVGNEFKSETPDNIDVSMIPNGRVLGIKLYPPLGFNPYPEQEDHRESALKFYTWCLERNIPITVHCQPSSFTTTKSKKEVDGFTDSSNWLSLFQENEALRQLRINFAHFGGEKNIIDTLLKPGPKPLHGSNMAGRGLIEKISRKTWGYRLIQLLKDYPNTYADISAYDFADRNARRALRLLFEFDAEGEFESGHRLREKLLWGSDVPMVISGPSYRRNNEKKGGSYKYLLENFENALSSGGDADPGSIDKIVKAMTNTNPMRFLFGK